MALAGGGIGGGPARLDLLQLQGTAGNRAVARLIAREDFVPPGNTNPLRKQPWPLGPWLPDPIDDERIAWIQDLPHRALIETIDGLGDAVNSGSSRSKGYRVIDRELKATTDAAKRARLLDEREKLDVKHHDRRVTNRNAFLDYFACTLGGDAGTKAYFTTQLDSFMNPDLIVHKTVKERLEKVRAELEQVGLPMPHTTVGQSLRGDHTKSVRQFDRASLLIHALGVAIDWRAYRNPNLVDSRLHALIEGVTGESNRMALPLWVERRNKIKAMGKAAAGQGTAPTDQQQFLDLIGTEFDRVKAVSEAFRNDLPEANRADLGKLEGEVAVIRGLIAAVGTANARLNAARKAAKNKPDAVAPAEAALTKAEDDLKKAREALTPKLEKIFKPWTDKLADRVKALETEATDLGVDLRKVQPEDWLVPLRAEIRGHAIAERRTRGDVTKVDAEVARTVKDLAAVVDKTASFQAWLDDDTAVTAARGVKPDQVTKWKADLPTLSTALGKSLAGAEALRVETQKALGVTPPTPGPTPAAPKAPKARQHGDRDLEAWRKALAAGDAKLADLLKRFPEVKQAFDTAAATAQDATTRLSTYEQQNAQIKKDIAASKKVTWNQLVARRRRLTALEMASTSLISDLDFVFNKPEVKNPGVAQLVGASHTAATGKGGFFEPDEEPATEAQKKAAATLAKNKQMSLDFGFGKLFYQSMAKQGFDLGAAWDGSQDTMHFELVELVESIKDPKSCNQTPAP